MSVCEKEVVRGGTIYTLLDILDRDTCFVGTATYGDMCGKTTSSCVHNRRIDSHLHQRSRKFAIFSHDLNVTLTSHMSFGDSIPSIYPVMAETKVYFEKQGGDRLCGVHCLNALLQGPVFTQADLNKFAAELDKEESSLLVSEQKNQQPRSMTISSLSNRPQSHNVDDTGNFSLGVLEKALKSRFGLVVENAARRDIIQSISREGFKSHDGFVIHLRDHWFSARAIPNPSYSGVREWYFLDSLKNGPQPVTENDLWGTIQGLIQSGNNVFTISGGRLPLPISSSTKPPVLRAHQFYLTRKEIKDRLALTNAVDTGEGSPSTSTPFQVVDPKKQKVETDWSKLGQGQSLSTSGRSVQDTSASDDLAKALAESMKDAPISEPIPEPSSDEPPNSIVQLMVRFPSGSRQVRKFSLTNATVADVFIWLKFVATRSLSPPVLLDEFALVGTMDRRGTKIVCGKNGFLFTAEQGTEPSPRGDPNDAVLSSIGLSHGQEAFNLQYI